MSLSHSNSSHVVAAAVATTPPASSSSSLSPSRQSYLTKTALRLSRKQQLEAMHIKRKGNFNYLHKVHNGNAYWLNCVLLSKDFLRHYTSESVPYQRAVGYYYLGLGLSNISKFAAGNPTVKALSQLIEEYEYYMSSAMMQSVKYVAARTATSPYGTPTSTRSGGSNSNAGNSSNGNPTASQEGGEVGNATDSAPPSRDASLQDSQTLLAALSIDTDQPSSSTTTNNNIPFSSSGSVGAIVEGTSGGNNGDSSGGRVANDGNNGNSNSLYKFNGEIIFQYFMTPIIPMELYYPEVVSATAELLGEIYEKLLHEDCYGNASTFESIVRLDGRIKTHFISLIAKELTDIAVNESTEGITQLRNSNIDFF